MAHLIRLSDTLNEKKELNNLEAPGELQVNTVSKHATNTKADTSKLTCHQCTKPGDYKKQCCQLKKKQTEPAEVAPINLTRLIPNNITKKSTLIEQKSQKLFTHPVRHVEKQTTPQRNAVLEPMQPIDHLRETLYQKDRVMSSKETTKTIQAMMFKLQLKI